MSATPGPSPLPAAAVLDDATVEHIQAGFDRLRVFAECFNDAQQSRISLGNRIGGAARHNVAVPPDAVEPVLAVASRSEAEWKRALLAAYRRDVPAPIRAWQERHPGIGPHSVARLLGQLGHPVLAFPHHRDPDGELVGGEPFLRNVGKLWAYCGYGDPTLRRRRGMPAADAAAMGNQQIKPIVWFLAVSAMRQTNPGRTASDTQRRSAGDGPPVPALERVGYRWVYDEGRARYATREGWTLGHQHAAALRLTAKAILRDLWHAGWEHLATLDIRVAAV